MTARAQPRGGRGARCFQWTSAVIAVTAAGGLILIGASGPARGATSTGYDQITGAGETDSAVTVPWTQGLLDSGNRPITSAVAGELAPNSDRSSASPTGPVSFMYNDFKNLKVTVSQTQNITHQGITVSWTGGVPTTGGASPQSNFLELVQCYGDSATGPDPEDCEFGSPGVMPSVPNYPMDSRSWDLCAAGSAASVTSPPGSADGASAANGCDPAEPTSPSHVAPCTGSGCVTGPPQSYTIPFVPVSDPSDPVYDSVTQSQWFNEFNTNEVPLATTAPDGTGDVQFETLTGTEAPGMGCGEPEADGSPRGCWLVIVPRGQYEPNGYQIHGFVGTPAFITSPPLSASNWAQRIQIHLGFAPTQVFCPVGAHETETVGTVLAARAVTSWQLALNQQADCNTIYGYSAVPEATSTQQLGSPDSGAGLAFTTIPIGSEAIRDSSGGTSTVTLPNILYAPVAISAVALGFNIDDSAAGQYTTPVKLSPQVLARALTQAYITDLPDFYHALPGYPGPSWAQSNPTNLSFDAQFQALNPGIATDAQTAPLAPLLTEDHSALNQQLWEWIQTDHAASTWLDGTAADGVTPDPDYTALNLGKAPAVDSFPRAYSGCLDLGTDPGPPPKEETKCSLDLLSYTNTYQTAASTVLSAVDSATTLWDPTATAPDGTGGWWDKVGREPFGSIFMWGLSDTADLAAFGLTAAQLCDDSGSNCVGPSTASLTAALNSATPDSSGLLQVDPAKVGAGAYPFVDVTYAAVPTDQSPAALSTYANLIAYAAGPGQTPGVAPGNLPPGYLPLPANLQAQAQSVVAQLRALANGASASASTSAGAGQPTGGLVTISGSQTPAPTLGATPTPGPAISEPAALIAASTTPREPVGAIRWALLVVGLAGAACAVGGAVLRSARVPQWLGRLRQ